MGVCTRLVQARALAALVVCILRMLYRLRVSNQRWRLYTSMLIRENRWRAMRYSIDEGLVDMGQGRIVPFAQLLEELLELTAEDAEALGCSEELSVLRQILQRGTSAHRQLAACAEARAAGADSDGVMRAVVDQLIRDTAEGL